MHATLLTPRRGWQWLVDGFAIFRRNPPVLGLVVISYWLLLGLLGLFGFLGMIAAALATPALSVGVAVACRGLANRQPVQPMMLFDGFVFKVDFTISISVSGMATPSIISLPLK